jgi:hypothetical protein
VRLPALREPEIGGSRRGNCAPRAWLSGLRQKKIAERPDDDALDAQGARKNVLGGAGLQLLFPVELIDDDFRNKPAPELLSSILRESRLVLTCGACGRLHVVDESGRQEPETYVPES